MFELRPYNRKNHMTDYNPFREIDAFEKSFFQNPFGFFGSDPLVEFRTDITDNGDHYLLEADLPGFEKKDINLDINGDLLTIRAERHSEHEETDKKNKYIRCERSYGSYSRSFGIDGIQTDGIKASYNDGVLKLVLPKATPVDNGTRRLAIE